MAYDYAPVGIDDDEEERKFPFPPVSPFGAPQSAYSDMPPVASSAPPVSPAPADLSSQLSRPEESAINSPMPAAPPVSHPAQERLKALEAQGPPPVGELHGGKKVLDTLGKIFTPNLEQAIRYGPQLKYERQRNQALGDVKAEQEPEESQAKVEQQKALAEQEQARAEALKNPPVKPKEEVWKTVPGMVGPKGQVLQEEQNSGQIRWAPGIEGAGPLKEPNQQKPDSPEQQFLDEFQRLNKGATIAQAEAAYQKLAHPPADKTDKNTARSDKSYQYNDAKLDKLGQPIEQVTQRLGRLQDTISQNSPQADALIAPELMTVMAGGQGSGLRMNEAEISRVVGGRSNWESLKAAANKWKLDPKEALSITPEQRQEIRALVGAVHAKLIQKQQILDQGREQLLDSDDPKEHRRIVADIHKKLTAIDENGGSTRFQVGNEQYDIPSEKKDAFLKQHPEAKPVQ